MEILDIKATRSTPRVYFDPNSHIHDIAGESYPEDAFEFYRPIMDWLEEYLSTLEGKRVVFNFDILYFNSSSSKVFMDIFDSLEDASTDNNIIVNWHYDEDNEAALEYGEDFEEDFASLEFNVVEKV